MKILIDNGHGSNTPGKCSPDGRLMEYSYTREIAVAFSIYELEFSDVILELIVNVEDAT